MQIEGAGSVMIWINDAIKRLQRYTTSFMTIATGYAAKTAANQRLRAQTY
jgi:hypothetical protein